MGSPTLPRFLIAGAFLGIAFGGAFYARARLSDPMAVLAGVRVDGAEIPPGADVRSFVEERASALRARRVRLLVADDTGGHALKEATLGELGVEVDVDRVVASVRDLGKNVDLVTRYEIAERAKEGRVDVPLLPVVNARIALPILASFKEAEDIPPVSARLDLAHHTVIHEKDGKYLDVDGAIAALQRVAASPQREALTNVVVPMGAFTPRVSSEFLAHIDINHVLASFETKFSRGQANRSRNVEVAAARINGVVLSPGQTMSFNEIVGARSEENGFQKAGEIFKGEMIEGVGGGTCQVASTLHAIAFYSGLDIIERLPHSRASAYIRPGLDATVVYPSVDLKLRNAFDFPVVIHAYVDGEAVKMELLGAKKPVSVEFASAGVGSFDFSRKVVEDPSVTKPIIKQRGMKGFQLRRTRTFIFANGEKKVETSLDTYPPVTEIYRVPPGYDAEELPPLGEDPSAKTNEAPAKPTKQPIDPYAPLAKPG